MVISGHQTTNKRQEAREIVKKATNASPDLDAVIFTGSGCTGAIHKLLAILDLNQASNEIKSCQKYQKHKHPKFDDNFDIQCQLSRTLRI